MKKGNAKKEKIRKSVLEKLREIMESDGEVSDEEQVRFDSIERTLNDLSREPSRSEVRLMLTSMSKVDGMADFAESAIIKKFMESLPEEAPKFNEGEKRDFSDNINPDGLQSTRELHIDGEAQIEVKDLNLRYGSAQALFDVSIPIEKNSVTSLIGPSGCGKSTLLRCLNRMNDLIPICNFDGSIVYDGDDINKSGTDLVRLRRKIGMVFQKPNPFPKSVFDNVSYGVQLHYNPSRRRMNEIVEKSLTSAALWGEVSDRLHELGTSLSGGQQQRLCIARTIAVEPDVILMDEPCSALDPIATAKIEDLITQLKEHFTVVIVTHSMSQAMRVSDYTAFMFLGRLIEFDRTEKIFNNPGNELTERYISGRFG
tara:strand:- start:3923 stop:5032 length:1110 start_codon:yes stop_codon:yes gene_type:complete